MTFREKAVIRLVALLAGIIGRGVDGFYSVKFNEIIDGLIAESKKVGAGTDAEA